LLICMKAQWPVLDLYNLFLFPETVVPLLLRESQMIFFQPGTRPNFITYATKLQSSPVHTKMKTYLLQQFQRPPRHQGSAKPNRKDRVIH
jgi:hypothetical protein